MQEKILELIMYLVSEIRNDKRTDEIDIASLTKNGYTPAEISSAFSWLYEHTSTGENLIVGANSPHSHRILHEVERLALSNEAQGYLIQLRELGLLSDEDLESVIERVMMSGMTRVGLAEIRSVAASVLFENDEATRFSNRIIWNSNDTIQ